MRVEWQVEAGMRCDVVTYAAPNLSGKRGLVRLFPSGSRKGVVHVENVRSMVIRAPFGTRLVLITAPGLDWEQEPWRCIRITEQQCLPSERAGGLPGVRIPDLDLLDAPDAKRTTDDFQSSFRMADSLDDGVDWTFGRPGTIKGRVHLVRVERDGGGQARDLLPCERVARSMLEAIAADAPAAFDVAVAAAVLAVGAELTKDGVPEAPQCARDLEAWARHLK